MSRFFHMLPVLLAAIALQPAAAAGAMAPANASTASGTEAVAARPGPESGALMLLQPTSLIQRRVPSAAALSDYVNAVKAAIRAGVADQAAPPSGGWVVVAVRPGGHSMVWTDLEPRVPAELAARLEASVLAVPVLEVNEGTVVFAIATSLSGGPTLAEMPRPEAWEAAMEGREGPMEIGALVDIVWPPSRPD